MIAYFTGVPPHENAGHYCFSPDLRQMRLGRGEPPSPWADPSGYPLGDAGSVDAAWPGSREYGSPAYEQPEGVARVLHRDGWTLLSMWDRSADRRKNSHASFAFDTVLDAEAAVRAAREAFPTVWARIDARLAERGIVFRVETVP